MSEIHDPHTPATPLDGQSVPDPPPPAPPTTHLAWIARDAANRAAALLAGTAPITDPVIDTIRLLNDSNDATHAQAAAESTGLRPAELARLRTAFTFGGPSGVHVMLETIDADSETMTAATRAIDRVRTATRAPLRTEHNWITDDAANLQVRLGSDERWYPFTATTDGNWAPAQHPTTDPAAAYTAAATAKRNRHI
jgi:hypothetical protein